MKILYVAKHNSGGNDDEGAIAHALMLLGHEVVRVSEKIGLLTRKHSDCDFLLFHKWDDIDALSRVTIPAVFWYFDLVTFNDPGTEARNAHRIDWMNRVMPYIDMGFCTDGDWVDNDKTGKLKYLTQGADVRVAGRGLADQSGPDLLFTGSASGAGRISHIQSLQDRFKTRLRWVKTGLHGRELADLIARSKIVIAPDTPVTDRYWSNRVYLTLGFGGLLMHKWSRGLSEQYDGGRHLSFYMTRNELVDKIHEYLALPEWCERMREAALAHTLAHHTYTHRCETLINMVEEIL